MFGYTKLYGHVPGGQAEYAQVSLGDTVAVFGLGPIGQIASRIALHRGADRVVGVDPVPERLAMAARHGVEPLHGGQADDVTQAVAELTGGTLCHSVVEAVGMEAAGSAMDSATPAVKVQPDKLVALHQALGCVRRGGTLFPLGDLFDKQISLRMGQANVKGWVDDIVPLLVDDDPLGVDW